MDHAQPVGADQGGSRGGIGLRGGCGSSRGGGGAGTLLHHPHERDQPRALRAAGGQPEGRDRGLPHVVPGARLSGQVSERMEADPRRAHARMSDVRNSKRHLRVSYSSTE